MSGDSSQEKTEQPTSRKLEKAREKGQVAQSKDVPSALIMLFAVVYFFLAWEWILDQFKEMFYLVPRLFSLDFTQALGIGIKALIEKALLTIALPFAMMTAVAGVLAHIVQHGFLFSVDPVIPRPDKISLSSGFKRTFSAKQFVTTLLSLLKTIIVAAVLLVVLRTGISELVHAVEQCNVPCQQSVIQYLLRQLILYVLPLLLFMAILDFLFQRQQFIKDQRMTKEEVKREMKDIYGDPHVRGARQGIRRELAEQDIQKRIRTARLIILDMSMAVALQYEQGVTPLPIIVAIGKGNMARKMAEIGTAENVPLVSDPALAQELVDKGKIDQYIPDPTISRVAQLLRQTNANK